MNTAEPTEELLKDLPEALGDNNEYIMRVMVLDNFVVIEYSKRQLFVRHIHPNSFTSEMIEDNLLFDVVATTVQEAVQKMQKKIQDYKKSEV